ncbi:MAG: hypothetical protein U5Q44_05260 [Dehalococcoidia bacterium]|nr:hypothetical protein [Dehalococcoidia bacterium]
MTMYEALLWLHVTFASLWVGGGLFFNMYAGRVLSAGSDEEVRALPALVQWVGRVRRHSPLALATLSLRRCGGRVRGRLGLRGSMGFPTGVPEDTQLIIPAIAMGFLGPESRKVAAAMESGGARSAEATSRLSRLFWVARVDTLLLLIAVFLMTVKPG